MTFDEFYQRYPRRIARKDAERAWAKLNLFERAKVEEALPAHLKYWETKGTEKDFIPYPATWLNQGRYEDELDFAERVPKVAIAWWSTDDGVMKKAAEIGLRARAGESMPEFKVRVVETARRAA